MSGPNEQQRELITKTEGIYIADAGPGTGKTYTISLRYAHILNNKDVSPEDILLITFTNNAAENMKERIINKCDHNKAALRDAPISTFHSLCNNILREYGFEAPEILGIHDRLTSSTEVMENNVIEEQEFVRFFNSFIEKHPEHVDLYRVIGDQAELLGLIKTLGAKGIIPTSEGWFRNSDRHLDGDFDKFKEQFDKVNEPVPGANGFKQSLLRGKLTDYKNKCFTKDAPDYLEIRGEGVQVPERFASECFYEEREEFKQFIHDVYFEYIEYALSRNYINFSLMIMFAFALLCEDHDLREKLSYQYVMIDEFQDTNEIQFKLALLLSSTGNICVVGDWKQSIFSFQYASVDNILLFEERLKEYSRELNEDHKRIKYSTDIEGKIPLDENFRSTQEITDFSQQGLMVEATKKEKLEKEEILSRITHLSAVKNFGETEIGAYTAEDEVELILWKIEQLVSGELDYGDIAVLTRTRRFGLRLLKAAEKYGIPVAYEGGIQLFLTKPSLVLLAWLRVVKDENSKRGWAQLLDLAGYRYAEVGHILDNRRYPTDMCKFARKLKRAKTIGEFAREVFDKYGLDDPFCDGMIEVLQNVYNSTYLNTAEMINFIEVNIEAGNTYDVDSSTEENVFKIQTIHSSKGLEYPVVILADVGKGGGGFGSPLEFRDPIGLRQNKIYSEDGMPFNYDNWRSHLLKKCLSGDYDEERRLFYVAMTRAESYLFLTAEEGKESQFFVNMDIEAQSVEPVVEKVEPVVKSRNELTVEAVKIPSPAKYTSHALIEYSGSGGGMGMDYGTKVHNFAERYVKDDVEPENIDEENVKDYIDSLDGEVRAEVVCLLPLVKDGRKLFFDGVIDLLNLDGDTIRLVDFKTGRPGANLQEYFKQLSVYYHAVKGVYPDKEVEAYVLYTADGSLVSVDVLSVDEILAKL